MIFTDSELNFLISKCEDARYWSLGVLYETEKTKDSGFDPEHSERITSYQKEKISFCDALLSKLESLLPFAQEDKQ